MGKTEETATEVTNPESEAGNTPAQDVAPEVAPEGGAEAPTAEAAAEETSEVLEPEVLETEVIEPEPESEPEPEPTVEDKLRAEADMLRGKLRGVSKAYKDQQDELPRMRERFQAQARLQAERQVSQVVQEFFDPIMNLRRSLTSGSEPEQIVEGLGIVLNQFDGVLKKLGLEEVPGEGSDFNPDVHEALAVLPTPDEAADGKVMTVHRAGYSLKGKCIQPAQVVIAKYTEPAEA